MRKSYVLLVTIGLFILCANVSYSQWSSIDSIEVLKNNPDIKTTKNQILSILPTIKERNGEFDSIYVFLLEVVGELYYKESNIDSALYYQKINLEICNRKYPDDNVAKARSLIYYATYLKEGGQIDSARTYFKDGISIYRKLSDSMDHNLATSLVTYANFCNIAGDYVNAELNYLEAIKIYKNFYGNEPDLNLVITLNGLASFYRKIGDFKNAEANFYESLDMIKRTNPIDERIYAIILTNIGNLTYSIGNYDKAKDFFEQSLEISRRLFEGNDHNNIATVLHNLAHIYQKSNNYDRAEKYFIEALEMRRRLYKSDHQNIAVTIVGLADLYDKVKRFDEAEKLYLEVIEMRRRLFGSNHPDLMNVLNSLAVHYYDLKRTDEAIKYFEEAYKISQNVSSRRSTFYMYLLSGIGRAHFDKGDWDTAKQFYVKLFNNTNDIFENYYLSLSDNDKLNYNKTLHSFYDKFYTFALITNHKYPELSDMIFNNQLIMKGMLITTSSNMAKIILSSNDSNAINLYRSLEEKRNYLAQLFSLSKVQLEKKQINLDSIKKESQSVENQLFSISASYTNETNQYKMRIADIQSLMKDDEAAIEIFRYKYNNTVANHDSTKYFALLVTKKSMHSKLILIDDAFKLESDYFSIYKSELKNDKDNKKSYNNYWAEIAKHLKGINRVYVTSDGIYNQINLSTLKNPRTKKYLDDEIQVVLLTNLRDIATIKNSANDNIGEFVLFGDPDFENYPNTLTNLEREETSTTKIPSIDRSFTDGINLSPLPQTKEELKEIANILKLKGLKYSENIGADANELKLKSIASPKVLHLSTHGYFLKDPELNTSNELKSVPFLKNKEVIEENPLLRSMLFFSGSKKSLEAYSNENHSEIDSEDGILTAYEAQNLNLQGTELVVLAACETGLGDVRYGEGVYGLQRAFKQAGAKSIIMSLWRANDIATKDLMVSFYKEWLNGNSKRKAFELAKKNIRKKYRYPEIWGAFVLIGQ